MNADIVVSLMMSALEIGVIIASPMLIFGLLVGLIVSIFQAVTQIQEMTLSFVPKILAVVGATGFFFPWIISTLLEYTRALLTNMNAYIGK